MKLTLIFPLLILALAGCFARPEPFEVPITHPANPEGPVAPFAPPSLLKTDDALPSPEPSETPGGSMGGMEMGGHHRMNHGTYAEGER